MKPTPIHEVMRKIRPFAANHKVEFLRGLIAQEPKRSIRRVELEAALRDVINKQLGREIRQDRRAAS